jgi:hypothetical protein
MCSQPVKTVGVESMYVKLCEFLLLVYSVCVCVCARACVGGGA